MSTEKDISKLCRVFATKEDLKGLMERVDMFEDTQRKSLEFLEGEIASTRGIQQDIFRAVDKLATPMEELRLEYAVVKDQASRHDRWTKRIAKRTGVSLKE